jgi:hypothetical protein
MVVQACTFEKRNAMKTQTRVAQKNESLETAFVKVFIVSLLIVVVQFFTTA